MDNDIMNTKGSKWWKFDFHTHTTESDCYGESDKEIKENTTPEIWLKSAMEAEIDCIVISDHNTGKGIDQVKQKLKDIENTKPIWYRPLIVFPGVEINVGGTKDIIHLIAVFDPEKSTDTITQLLGAIGVDLSASDYQKKPSLESFVRVVDKIIEFGGIAIPAHIDGKKGILRDCTLNRALKDNLETVYAIEVIDPKKLDTLEPQLREIIKDKAVVQGSDAHKLGDLGRRFSWIKMSSPTIHELRLALLDRENSVYNGADDPNALPDIFVESLTITNMMNCGRIPGSPFIMEFSPKFNAIIGGRGAGKSTTLESMRIAARREHELSSYPKLNDDMERFLRTSENNGVMLEDTEISLRINRRSLLFKINWKADGSVPVSEAHRNGKWVPTEPGDLKERFPLSIYSQKQIFELASNPKGLLAIIDRTTEVNYSEWQQRWEILKSQFMQQREKSRELSRQISIEASLRVSLADIEVNLGLYEERGHKDILKHYQKRSQQLSDYPLDNGFGGLSQSLIELATQIEISDLPSRLIDSNDNTFPEMADIHKEINSTLLKIKGDIENVAAQVDELTKLRRNRIIASEWYKDVLVSIEKYNLMIKEYEVAKNQINLEIYRKWVQEKSLLQIKLNNIESLKKENEQTEEAYINSYNQMKALREELHNKRQLFIKKVIGQDAYVAMDVVLYGDMSNLEDSFRDILGLTSVVHKTSIFDSDTGKGILAELLNGPKNDFASNEIDELVTKVKNEALSIGQSDTANTAPYTKPFVTKLQTIYREQPSLFDALHCWWPDDKLIVKYSKSPHKNHFVDIEQGSKGQKAAAILAFLLSYGDEPLIIDQPEDDLDNALIYELVVKQIHESKRKRQLIIVTHNANIVVNGDAEYINVLEMKGGQIQIVAKGGFGDRDVQQSVCSILEGGKEAFRKRYERMSIGDSDV